MTVRRRWSRRLAVAALILVALVALRIVLGKTLGDWVLARERARFEREVGPVDPDRLESERVPDAENSLPSILAAVDRLALDREALAMLAAGRASAPPAVSPPDTLGRLLASRDAELDRLWAATRQRPSFGPRAELFHGAHFDGARWLAAARLADADGERALAAGDARRTARATEILFALATALRREPIGYFATVGAAIETIYLDLVRSRLAQAIDVAALAALSRDLEQLRALPDAFHVMHGEAVFGHDMLRRTPESRRPDASWRERIEALLWPWSPGHVEAGYLAGWRELAHYASTPQSDWPPDLESAARRYGALRHWFDPTEPFETVRTILIPDLLSIARKLQLVASAEQLARLAAAVATHGSTTGALPASIAELAEAGRRDAASGSLPRYELWPDGAATLALPAAGELVERELATAPASHRHVVERRLRLLRWRLPPPAADSP